MMSVQFKKESSSGSDKKARSTSSSSGDMVSRSLAQKKIKTKTEKAKQLKKSLQEKAPTRKQVSEGVKKQGVRVGKTLAESVTPENIGKIYNDPGELVNIVTDITTGKKLIPQSDKSRATEITMKQKYDILVENIKELEGFVNRCCKDKGLISNIQFVDGEALFEKNLAVIKSENKDKYGKSIGFVKGLYDKFTPNKVERELLLGISGEKIVGVIIRRFTDMDDNLLIWREIKSIVEQLDRGGDPNNLTPVQHRVVDDIQVLIDYSNISPDKKARSNRIGLMLSDILRLIMGYYVFDLVDEKIVVNTLSGLYNGEPFGDLRFQFTKVPKQFTQLLNFFQIYMGVRKEDMRSTFTNLIKSRKDKDKKVIQSLYDKGGVKKKMTKKKMTKKNKPKKHKKKKKTKMR